MIYRRADAIVNTNFQSPSGRRHFFDVAPLFAVAAKCWRENGLQMKVRVEQIVDEELPRVWTHPESVFRIVNRFVMDAIDSSIEGSVVEVAVRVADEDGDWIAFTVRDWAGGKPDGWSIDATTQQLAKQIDGHIDIANHPGRNTICSLHLPSGSLSGWLCRQSASASGFFVSWNPEEFGGANSKCESTRVDEAIQLSLQPLGSLVPSGDNAYLFASSSPIDQETLKRTIAKQLQINSTSASRSGTTPVQVEYFGLMGEFMHRLESSIPTSTCDLGWESLSNQTGLITRIDTPLPGPSENAKPSKRPALAVPSGTRMRPRRVQVL